MKCATCKGLRIREITPCVIGNQSFVPKGENWESCPDCQGKGGVPDFTFEGRVSLESGVYLFADHLRDDVRISLAYVLEEMFPELEKGPVKLKITIERAEY